MRQGRGKLHAKRVARRSNQPQNVGFSVNLEKLRATAERHENVLVQKVFDV
jgi:hypothetical protein